jgi:hypothetical protein
MQVLGEDTKTSGGGETSQGVEDEGGTDPNPKGQGAGDGEGKAADDGTETKKKRERRELERGEGRSIFPFARVQRTLKADKVRPHSCSLSLYKLAIVVGFADSNERGDVLDLTRHRGVYKEVQSGYSEGCG